MKNLILTFHRAKNYGAVLQAYALSTICNQYQYTEMLDYDFSNTKSIKKLLKKLFYFFRNKKFDGFLKKYMNLSKKINTEEKAREYINKCDKVIVGSDQVWNTKITRDSKDLFLLKNILTEKYSYAASLGDDCMNELFLDELIDSIKKYKMISVREQNSKELIEKKSKLKVSVCLDPTLLLQEDKWQQLIKNESRNLEKIVVYFAEQNDEMNKISKLASKVYNKKLIVFDASNKTIFKKLKTLYYGPIEFIESIRNSKLVITNSFHGLAFSIIFKKQFILFLNSNRSSRQTSLLKMLNLEDRIYSNNFQELVNKKIDYSEVQKKLEEERKKSLSYISRIFGDDYE